MIYMIDMSAIHGSQAIAFYESASREFFKISGEQVWSSWDEFKEAAGPKVTDFSIFEAITAREKLKLVPAIDDQDLTSEDASD